MSDQVKFGGKAFQAKGPALQSPEGGRPEGAEEQKGAGVAGAERNGRGWEMQWEGGGERAQTTHRGQASR